MVEYLIGILDQGISYSSILKVLLKLILVILAVIIATSALDKAAFKLLNKFKGSSSGYISYSIIRNARTPIKFLIWLSGISYATEILFSFINHDNVNEIYYLYQVGVIVVLSWVCINIIKQYEKRLFNLADQTDAKIDKGTADSIGKLLRIIVVVSALLVILQTLGFSLNGLLAIGSISGVAVAFAGQDLLSNIFGAITIYLDKPFIVGNWIKSPDKNIEGMVDEISWRLTKIITFEKRPLYIPNSLFSKIILENPSRMTHRRIYENVHIRYEDVDKVDDIVGQIRSMLKNHLGIDATQTLVVSFKKFGPYSLELFLYTFTNTIDWTNYNATKQDVLLKIARIIKVNGAKLAYPTQTLQIPRYEYESEAE